MNVPDIVRPFLRFFCVFCAHLREIFLRDQRETFACNLYFYTLMSKLDPIIAVKDVAASAQWYCRLLGCKDLHGGSEFAILVNETGEVLLCLHAWEAHGHPTMKDPSVTPGNGLILYFRTENMNEIRENARKAGLSIEEEVHLNPNSQQMEFSLRDPDGYFVSITGFHTYEG